MSKFEFTDIEKHRRPVVVVLAVEEYERLKAIESKKSGV